MKISIPPYKKTFLSLELLQPVKNQSKNRDAQSRSFIEDHAPGRIRRLNCSLIAPLAPVRVHRTLGGGEKIKQNPAVGLSSVIIHTRTAGGVRSAHEAAATLSRSPTELASISRVPPRILVNFFFFFLWDAPDMRRLGVTVMVGHRFDVLSILHCELCVNKVFHCFFERERIDFWMVSSVSKISLI